MKDAAWDLFPIDEAEAELLKDVLGGIVTLLHIGEYPRQFETGEPEIEEGYSGFRCEAAAQYGRAR